MTIAALLIIIGRVILGGFFVVAGGRNFLHFSERKAAPTLYGWTMPPWLTALGFASQLIGGLAVLFGVLAAWGAGLLILFLVAATALFHNFTLFQGKERDPHFYLTLVNTCLVGFCLMVIGLSI